MELCLTLLTSTKTRYKIETALVLELHLALAQILELRFEHMIRTGTGARILIVIETMIGTFIKSENGLETRNWARTKYITRNGNWTENDTSNRLRTITGTENDT